MNILNANGTFKLFTDVLPGPDIGMAEMEFNMIKSCIPKQWIIKLRNNKSRLSPVEQCAIKINNRYIAVDKLKCKEIY